jgi:3-isopropylmalate/(R)-2-methylmalate dehydratase large subunit
MSQTLVEKILSRAAGKPARTGELVVVPVSLAYAQDWTGPLTVKQVQELGWTELKQPDRVAFFIDHSAPSSTKEHATNHMLLRDFARRTGCRLFDVGEGVCHALVPEQLAKPWDVIVGADSHTCTPGALGAFATGMGSTDVAVAMGLGKTWLRVPEAMKVVVRGRLQPGVYAKDIILWLIGHTTAEGATYKSLEFCGPTIDAMPVHERLVISNMAVEAGAKCGIMPADEQTRAYLAAWGREQDFEPLTMDDDAEYPETVELNADTLVPQVSLPHTVDNVRPIDHPDCADVKLDQVYIGSCTNGRYEDFVVVAEILKGRRAHRDCRLVLTPASRDTYRRCVDNGLFDIFLEAGAAINSPGCGACPGSQTGIIGDGERCLASINRNFKGRLGSPEGFVYLGSPATCAASAIEGRLADPRRYF